MRKENEKYKTCNITNDGNAEPTDKLPVPWYQPVLDGTYPVPQHTAS